MDNKIADCQYCGCAEHHRELLKNGELTPPVVKIGVLKYRDIDGKYGFRVMCVCRPEYGPEKDTEEAAIVAWNKPNEAAARFHHRKMMGVKE